MIQPTLINLHPNEYSQELHYYLFVVKLDRFVGGCNTLDGLSNKVCVPNKTGDLNLSVFNMITITNEWKTFTSLYHASVNLNFIVESVFQTRSGIMINAGTCRSILYVEKIIFGILLYTVGEMIDM